jgi:hypothetical protein
MPIFFHTLYIRARKAYFNVPVAVDELSKFDPLKKFHLGSRDDIVTRVGDDSRPDGGTDGDGLFLYMAFSRPPSRTKGLVVVVVLGFLPDLVPEYVHVLLLVRG